MSWPRYALVFIKCLIHSGCDLQFSTTDQWKYTTADNIIIHWVQLYIIRNTERRFVVIFCEGFKVVTDIVSGNAAVPFRLISVANMMRKLVKNFSFYRMTERRIAIIFCESSKVAYIDSVKQWHCLWYHSGLQLEHSMLRRHVLCYSSMITETRPFSPY